MKIIIDFLGKELSQLENTQNVVLQQTDGKKIYLDLNVSTDTTAIWSFWLAMIIALILGSSATLIAIWYGRKSFKLTEMSFKLVVEEIQSSQKVALRLNKELFEQQKYLQINELDNIDKQKWLFEVRTNLAIYSKNYEILRYKMLTFNKKYYLDINVHLNNLDNFETENKLAKYNELNEINNLTEIILDVFHKSKNDHPFD